MKPDTEEPVISSSDTEDKEVLKSQLKALEDVSTEIEEKENIEAEEVVSDENTTLHPARETFSKEGETGGKISEDVTSENNLPTEKDLFTEQEAHEAHPEREEAFSPAPTPISQEELQSKEEIKEERFGNKPELEEGDSKDSAVPVSSETPEILPKTSKKPEPELPRGPAIEEKQGLEEERTSQEQKPSFFRFGLIIILILFVLAGGAVIYTQFFGIPSQLSFLKHISFLEQIPFLKTAEETPTPSPIPSPVPSPGPEEPVLTPEEERDNQRIGDLNTLRDKLSLYHEAVGSYPVTDGTERILVSTVEDSVLYQALVPGYLLVFPVDPGPVFYYGYSSDGISYELTSVLENQDNQECVLIGEYCVRKIKDGEVVSIK